MSATSEVGQQSPAMAAAVQPVSSHTVHSQAVYSMTGYARTAGRISDALSFTLTLKSINHRYLDLQLRMPAGTEGLEATLRQRLKEHLVRGHIECVLTLERNRPGNSNGRNGSPVARPVPVFDQIALAAYVTAFRTAARMHGLTSEPDLNDIARIPGMLLNEPPDAAGIDRTQEAADEEAMVQEVLARLQDVLTALRTMRADEGASLAAILREGLCRLETTVDEVATLRASVQDAHFARIQTRLDALLGGSFDRGRILQEAALLAERSDVEEEIARMRTHIEHFRSLLAGGGELGKKLDFLLQEMNREANTLLSKTAGVTGNGARITICGLAMKAEIEKAREQVQNLE
jgi:uncharacterized protein (TIGR00255 family)